MREDSHNFDKNVDKFEDFRIIDFLVDFVFSDVISDVEERHQLYLKFFVLKTKFDLHSFHRMRLHDEFNIFLEIVLDDLYFHLLFVVSVFSAFLGTFFFVLSCFIFGAFFSHLLCFILFYSFIFLNEVNIFNIFSSWGFFR
jgi:hypothetical protein